MQYWHPTVGDKAYYLLPYGDLYVLKGGVVFTVSVDREPDEDAAEQQAVTTELAKKAAARIP